MAFLSDYVRNRGFKSKLKWVTLSVNSSPWLGMHSVLTSAELEKQKELVLPAEQGYHKLNTENAPTPIRMYISRHMYYTGHIKQISFWERISKDGTLTGTAKKKIKRRSPVNVIMRLSDTTQYSQTSKNSDYRLSATPKLHLQRTLDLLRTSESIHPILSTWWQAISNPGQKGAKTHFRLSHFLAPFLSQKKKNRQFSSITLDTVAKS